MAMEAQGITIWTIVTDSVLREGISLLLDEVSGYSCTRAFKDVEGALEYVRGIFVIDYPDVILLDIDHPSGEGIKALASLRRDVPSDVKIVALASSSDPKRIYDAKVEGASGFVGKNYSPEKISEAILDAYLGSTVWVRSIKKNEVTFQEQQVVILKSLGYSDEHIGVQLEIPYKLVGLLLRRILARLRVTKAVEALAAINSGIVHVSPPEIMQEGEALPLSLVVDPGTAPPEFIADILSDLSTLYRMTGGSGITFSLDGVHILEEEMS